MILFSLNGRYVIGYLIILFIHVHKLTLQFHWWLVPGQDFPRLASETKCSNWGSSWPPWVVWIIFWQRYFNNAQNKYLFPINSKNLSYNECVSRVEKRRGRTSARTRSPASRCTRVALLTMPFSSWWPQPPSISRSHRTPWGIPVPLPNSSPLVRRQG